MEHRNISRLLMLAGCLATLGILFVFYLSTPLRILANPAGLGQGAFPWGYVLFKAVCGLPYLLALGCYFGICSRIGMDNSFCAENVTDMNRITILLLISALIWAIALLGQLMGLMDFLTVEAGFAAYILICADLLAMMASLAVALVAKMMAYLVNRAVLLQEDSDLTI